MRPLTTRRSPWIALPTLILLAACSGDDPAPSVEPDTGDDVLDAAADVAPDAPEDTGDTAPNTDTLVDTEGDTGGDTADIEDIEDDSSALPDADADTADVDTDGTADTDTDPDVVEPDRPAACDASALYVSATRGDDANVGTEDAPLATLAEASLAARDGGQRVVCVEAGRYPIATTWHLEAADSGVSYYALGGRVQVTGGVSLDPEGFVPLDAGDPAYDRIPSDARAHVRVADLPALGVEDYGTLRPRTSGVSALELRVDGTLMELARWPNVGVTETWDPSADAIVSGDRFGEDRVFSYLGTTAVGNADDGFPNYVTEVDGEAWYLYHCSWTWEDTTPRYWVVSQTDPRESALCWPTATTSWVGAGNTPHIIPQLNPLGTSADTRASLTARNTPPDLATDGMVRTGAPLSTTSFAFAGDRWRSWLEAPEPWLHGLFANYWYSDRISFTVSDGAVSLGSEPTYGLNGGMPFYAYNLLEELDTAGEFYVERATGRLYLWPTGPLSRVEVSLLEEVMVQLNDVSDLRIEGFDFDMSRVTLVVGSGLERVVFADCGFADSGASGASIEGRESGFDHCTFANLGSVGVSLQGGERETLTAGENFVRHSVAYNFGRWGWTYQPAVRLAGCGNRVEHNHFFDAPHAAILFSGNAHHIAYNELDHVVLRSGDAGAIYVGRDWGYRGTVIEHNHIHHIESVFGDSHGVYLDDAVSGITLRSNLIHDIHGRATMAGGGRDHTIVYNILVDTERGAHFCDRRAVDKANDTGDSWDFLGRLNAIFESYRHGTPIAYQDEPWASAYPRLAAVPNDWSQVRDSHWLEPEGNVFADNLYWHTSMMIEEGGWGGLGCAEYYQDTTGNLEADPLFIGDGDYHLDPGSPAYTIPDFVPIDLDAVGPQLVVDAP